MLKPPTVTSCCVKTCLHNFRNWLGESAGLFFWILYLHHMQVSIAIKHVFVFPHTVHAITGLRLSFLSILIMHFGFLGAHVHTLTNYHINAYTLSYARSHTLANSLSHTYTVRTCTRRQVSCSCQACRTLIPKTNTT